MEAIVHSLASETRESHLSACTVVLTVPKLSTVSHEGGGREWGRCLHTGYLNGWMVIGSQDSPAPRAIGKPSCFTQDDGVTRVSLYFLLVQQPDNPTIWLRGSLDETVINLDARASRPSLSTGQPIGMLGGWPIKFVAGNRNGWQYREIYNIITLANLSLPDDHKIDLCNESCLNPYKLWMPKKSIVGYNITGAA